MGTIHGFGGAAESTRDWTHKNSVINKESLHACVIGPTGSGKTMKALDLISERLKNGHAIVVFDAKQVLQESLAELLEDRDRTRMYQLGIDNGGDNSIKINLFSHITNSESTIKRFAKSILIGDNPQELGSHLFWAQAGCDLLTTVLGLYSCMNKFLMHVGKISGKEIEFSIDITYKHGEETRKVPFTLSSVPLTFENFFSRINTREDFRQIASNILKIKEAYLTYIKLYVDINNISREDALEFDIFINKINKYSRLFNAINLPIKEDYSGESGALWSMKAGIPALLYTDKTLNSTFDTHDLKELLENKKGNCVIISANDLRVQSLLFNLYAEHFSLRTSLVDANPVSFILDEANSMVGTGTAINLEHYLTFARSSKLSIISLWQSNNQLYQAFGNNRAGTILENVTRISLSEKRDSKYFYYTVDDDDYLFRFETKFSTQKEKYEALKAYQEETNEFSSLEKSKREVVIYNHAFYDATKQITLVNIDTLKSRNVRYIADETQYYGYFMDGWKNINSTDEVLDDNEQDLLEALGIEI